MDILIYLMVFGAVALGMYAYVRLAVRWRLVDTPNARSSHDRIVPRGGGVLFVGLFLLVGILYPCLFVVEDYPWPLLLSVAAVALLSFVDDLWGLSSLLRLLLQMVIVGVAIYFIEPYSVFSLGGFNFSLPTVLAWGLGLMWIVGCLNVYNFMDGIDGIAGIQAVCALLGYQVLFVSLGYQGALVSGLYVLLFGVLGFLVWNWHPAKVFMGDVGAAFLGICLALLPMQLVNSDTVALTKEQAVAMPVGGALMLFPFLFDGLLTFLRRCKHRENVLRAHRSHLYQRLTKVGWPHYRVTVLYGAWAVLSASLAVVYVLNESWQVWVLLLLFATGVGMYFFVRRQENCLQPVEKGRIYLSPPAVGEAEKKAVVAALDSGWVAPVGPDLTAFEEELAVYFPGKEVVALTSGTSALHLMMLAAGVKEGDRVLFPSLTFVAPVNAALYCGAQPVFVDSAKGQYALDVDLLGQWLAAEKEKGAVLPVAVVAVDLYGECCDYVRLQSVCDQYGLLLLEDAAEAVGAEYEGRWAGNFGEMAALSFNGNKLMTTGGGGAVVCQEGGQADRLRYLAAQAKLDRPWYEHEEVGYNYRMSNVLAAIGRAQLSRIEAILAKRKRNWQLYVDRLADLPQVRVHEMPLPGSSNHWLVNLVFDVLEAGQGPEELRIFLKSHQLESRRIWKPMHLQPLFEDAEMIGGAVAEDWFARGLSVPSGTDLTEGEIDRICVLIKQFFA